MSSPRPLTDAARLEWLRLCRTENVGPVGFRQLLARYGNAAEALAALPELARRGGRSRPLRVPSRADAERELAATARFGATLLAFVEPGYPAALAALEDAPPLILLKGHAHLLAHPAVAVVGARNASANGRLLAERLARDLGAAGFLVVSGLARGIDTSAHQGALASGTAAVLAGGLDIAYPPQNARLQEAIEEQGLLLSEMPLGTEPQARHFPRRNRIISGLSLGVVVVEAALRSGSLITARLAADQGREVFAVPGSPLDPRAHGTNELLRQGATLVESAADVLAVLSSLRPPLKEPAAGDFRPTGAGSASEDELSAARPQLLELLGPAPVALDLLLRQSGLSPDVLSLLLLELELAGRIERQAGGSVALLPAPEGA